MLRIAAAQEPRLVVSDLELCREGVSYTWQTVAQLREENPDAVDAPYDYVMMMLTSMNDNGLLVFPTHRMIRNLPDF